MNIHLSCAAATLALLALLADPRPLSAQTSAAAKPNLRFTTNGEALGLLRQPDGKLIVAGTFTSINGEPRHNIARLNPNGSVDLTWRCDTDQTVIAIAIAGGDLFVTGPFSTIGGVLGSTASVARVGLAKVSLADGGVDPEWQPVLGLDGVPLAPTGTAVSLVAANGWLYAAGIFSNVNGTPRSGLARLSTSGAGSVDPVWNPNPTNGKLQDNGAQSTALTLLVNGDAVYVAGDFATIGGISRRGVAKVSALGAGAVDTSWNAQVGGASVSVTALALRGTELFVGGQFTSSGGLARSNLAKLRASDGSVDPEWDPAPGSPPRGLPGVDFIEAAGDSVFVCGNFGLIGGASRIRLAKLDATGTGQADPLWSATPNAGIVRIMATPEGISIAGAFQQVGDATALGMARLDPIRGTRDETFPVQIERAGRVFAMVKQLNGARVLGGDFWLVDSLPRRHLVRVSAEGTLDTTWSPSPNRPVMALALSGDDLFAGGYFTEIGGLPRGRLAKLSIGGGPLIDPQWTPSVDKGVLALVTNGAEVIAGGEFATAGGLSRNCLAKFSAFGTGAVSTTWDPQLEGESGFFGLLRPRVYALALASPNLYVGGQFQSIGGLERYGLARIRSDGSGTVDSLWRCNITFPELLPELGSIYSLALAGSELFVGGFFTEAANAPRICLAKALTSASGGIDSTWAPDSDGAVGALAVSGDVVFAGAAKAVNLMLALLEDEDVTQGTLFFGTGFSYIGGADRRNFAALSRTGFGSALPLNVAVDDGIFTLNADGDDLFVGGNFQLFGGETRTSAALLATVGAPVITQDPSSITGVLFARNASDGTEVTHFRITSVAGGSLLKPDGSTPVAPGDFITAAEGSAGLVFLASGTATPTVSAVAAVSASESGAGTAATTAILVLDRVLPVVRFTSAAYTAAESNGVAVLQLSKAAGVEATVTIATTGGTAQDGADYTGTSGTTVTLAANETLRALPILIAQDMQPEPDETFTVRLSSTAGATIADPSVAEVTIRDSDRVGQTGSLTEIVAPSPAQVVEGTGQLHVLLAPAQASGQWRLAGDFRWRNSGETAIGLTPRTYIVEFRPVQGYDAPDRAIVNVAAAGTRELSATYTPVSSTETGSVMVKIEPASVAQHPDPALRGRWRRPGESTWRDSGTTVADVIAGSYPIEFQPIVGFDTPPPREVVVAAGQENIITAIYSVADTTGGAPTSALTFEQANALPFAYNGQLESNSTFASGFVVQRHTVLTAAHVLFDDLSLSYVTGVRWFHQRYRDHYEPPPQFARGWIVFDGYARQRAIDSSPGQGTLSSHQSDVAAVYFPDFAARGGFGGYLASDLDANEWLLSHRSKMLTGYPIAGFTSAAADAGKLHATPAADVPFARLLGRVFASDQIKGFPGNSGGPLYVQADNQSFYPAAVYLGGTSQTLVRAIDGSVVDLINRAETIADGGQNNSNAGIANLSPGLTNVNFSSGTFSCKLLPVEGLPIGAGWRISGQDTAFRNSSDPIAVPSGNLRIEFKPLPGFLTPASRTATISAGQLTRITATYYQPVVIDVSASPPEGGTVKGGVFGKGLQASAVARPAVGYRFTRWSEQGAEASLAQRYDFTANSDRSLVAEFLPGPFTKLASPYYAFVSSPEGATNGFLSLKLNAAGRFTANLRFAGKTYKARGSFDLEGNFTILVDRRTGLLLELTLDLIDGSGTIAGRLMRDDVPVAVIVGARAPFSKQRLTSLSGRYTVLLSPTSAPDVPPGIGYGIVDVKPDGALLFKGTLGDGTKISQSAAVIANDEWPLFATPYRGKGLLSGRLKFAAQPSSDFTGSVSWTKAANPRDRRFPIGFDAVLACEGAQFALDSGEPPLSYAAGALRIGPEGLVEIPPTLGFTASADGKLTFDEVGSTGRIDRKTGLIRGAFKIGRERRSFGGAVLRKSGRAAGTYLAPTSSDSVAFEPVP